MRALVALLVSAGALCTQPYCCAQGSTVLTNPKHLHVERIFYALQVRTKTTKGFVHTEKNIA